MIRSGGNLRQRSGGEAQFHKSELLRMVRVGAERNAHALFAGDFQKTDPQVLPIRIAVDLHRFVEPRGFGEDLAPIRIQPLATIPHARLRMTEDLNTRISQAGQVAARLILFPTERGMETAEHQVELSQRRRSHVACALG